MIEAERLLQFCRECQSVRVAQKDGLISSDTGKPTHKKGDFIVRCEGIPGDGKFIPRYDKIAEKLSPDEVTLAQGLYDPISWAEQHINWKPRKSNNIGHSYQEMILQCSSPRKVLRLGRRLGKCLALDSLVLTKEQGLVPIKDIKPEETIATLDDNDGKIKWTNNWYLQDNGIQKVYSLQTRLGNIDHVTENHPYLKFTSNGLEWTEVKDLSPGDRIAIPKTYQDMYLGDTTNRSFYRLLGYLISDGGTNYKSGVRFSNDNNQTLEDISEIAKEYNCYLKSYGGVDYGIICDEWNKNPILDICRKNNLQHLAKNKKIPAKVYSASNGDVAEFLGAAWDCDGWICDNEIGYCSASYDLANGIKHLLKRFGINATLTKKYVKYQDIRREAWTVGICNLEDSCKFHANIKLIAKEKKLADSLSKRLEKENFGNDWLHTFPKEIHSIIEKELYLKKLKWKDIKRNENCRQRKEYGPTYSKIIEINKKLQSSVIDGFLNSNILFDEIKSITYRGEEPTLDFSVGDTHNFIANDTVTHNTETLVIAILHFLFTNSPKVQRWDDHQKMYVDGFSTILVLTPYLSQIKLIFARIRELIDRNPALKNEIKKDVSTPFHHLELYNGAKVVGFSSGAKSGSGAETARGQKADFIVLDEMDYLNENDIETILALLMEHADVRLLCSSTPSGRREYFYNFCRERMDFKEFYYPAHVNPAWSPQMEAELREFYRTEMAWQHEILAEFGEATTGVFQHKYVEEARTDYYYKDILPINEWTYSIGVDWNDTANGTKLAVTGWDPRKQKFKVVDKVTVQKTGWTQTAAIDALINLNRIWRPEYIYVDEGYGATQIEIIKQYGLDARYRSDENATIDSNLQKVVGINSSARIEVFDPITKEPIKKIVKPFMIENAVRRFERQQVEFSEYDEELYRQLIGYQITKVSASGAPIYEAGPDGDHDLDAFVLSLLAFQMELSELTNVNYSTNIVFSGRIGEQAQSQNLPSGIEEEVRRLSPQTPEVRSEYNVSFFNTMPAANNNLNNTTRIYTHEAFNSDDGVARIRRVNLKHLRPNRAGFTSRRSF